MGYQRIAVPDDGLVIPFIGAFSSGKTSLINSLLGENLLSTDITPETALPVQLRFAEQESFVAIGAEKQRISREQLQESNFSDLATQQGYLEACLPTLKSWPDLTLVDLPGWSSGQREHEKQLDNYLIQLQRTVLETQIVYVIVASAEEGTLKDNVRQYFERFDIGGARYVLLISKTDKRDAGDLQLVKEHIAAQLEKAIGTKALAVSLCSARKKQIDGLFAFLDQLQEQVNHSKPVDNMALIQSLEQYIERLKEISQDKRDMATDIFDATWDAFDEDGIEYLAYRMHRSVSSDTIAVVANALKDDFIEKLNIQIRRLPSLSEEVMGQLNALGLQLPSNDGYFVGKAADLQRVSTRTLKDAIAKAKPGLFSSDDPEDQGDKMMSKVRSARSEFRSNIIGYAYQSLDMWLSDQINEYQRLKNLL